MWLVALFVLSILSIVTYNWLYHRTEAKYAAKIKEAKAKVNQQEQEHKAKVNQQEQEHSEFAKPFKKADDLVHKPLILYVPRLVVTSVLALVAIVSIAGTSIVTPSGSQIALLDRIYLCSSIQDGRNVALPGECGRQSKILMPGFTFSPFIRVLNKITFEDIIEVPEGQYATLTARDGLKLEAGQVAAKPWTLGNGSLPESASEIVGNMLDATYFLTDGNGRKGPQATVLTPGKYPVNTYLWNVNLDQSNQRTVVKPGFVGVIKSAIDDDRTPSFMTNGGGSVNCGVDDTEEALGQLRANTVPVGCRGVWKDPLPAGAYFLNTKVYDVTQVDTRMQNWTYKGGYTRRTIDLTVAEDGRFEQQETVVDVPKSEETAGDVILIKVEGWTVHQELRLQASVLPENAPLMVAAVGNLQEVEDKIITPQVRSVSRNIGGSRITVKNSAAFEEANSELNALKARLELLRDPDTDVGLTSEQREQEAEQIDTRIQGFEMPNPELEVTRPTRVLDFQNEREAIELLIAEKVKEVGVQSGIDIASVTLGNSDLPPELLVARKIEQLSGQLRNSYVQQRTAQVQRQAAEAAKARANKQEELVAARIDQEASQIRIDTRQNDGEAERKFLEEQAKGQEAQANVLGEDRVAMLRALQMIVDNPDFISNLKLPSTVVMGSGNGFEGASAILGATKLFGGSADTRFDPEAKTE